jgi:hypothetical protein
MESVAINNFTDDPSRAMPVPAAGSPAFATQRDTETLVLRPSIANAGREDTARSERDDTGLLGRTACRSQVSQTVQVFAFQARPERDNYGHVDGLPGDDLKCGKDAPSGTFFDPPIPVPFGRK